MRNNKTSKSQILFGVRCVLLALVLLAVSGSIIYDYVFGNGIGPVDLGLRGTGLVCAVAVLYFEITTYVKLYNEGVREIYREKNVELDKLDKFKQLVSKNEFIYNFQPIVDARNGEIYAYEVLMRTADDIGLKPLEVLKYAEISNMLYNVERSTFFNALKYYKENIDKFGGKKIFINSIPSVILPDSELSKLQSLYADVSENIVVEILENDDDDDNTIAAFDNLRNILNCNIAVDDYGSGYSNDMKVLNNNPNFIKIDMSLITSIDTDSKKQLLVSNLIKFGKKYNIKILAEGVETKEELAKVIELGVDLIQGFYTAKPSREVVPGIDEKIKDYISEENIRLSKLNKENRIYEASEGEIINVFNLSLEKYAGVFVPKGTVRFVGTKANIVDMVIKTADDTDTMLIFENVNIKGAVETTVQVGNNARTTIVLEGDNTFNKEGIYVPPDSSVIITGEGSLTVKNNRNGGAGIGASFEKPYGSILIDTNGSVTVDSSGDKIVCIGGGEKGPRSEIRIVNGKVNVMGRGIYAVGIGSASGDTDVVIERGTIITQCIANEAVSVGTMFGTVNIRAAGYLDLVTDGERATGIGVLNGGSGAVEISGGDTTSVIHGDIGTAIGSLGGRVDVNCVGGRVHAHAEGTRVCGIGALDAGGTVHISGGVVTVGIKSAEPIWIGSAEKQPIITGGNVVLEDNGTITAVNTAGEELVLYRMDKMPSYNENITTIQGSYTYRAQRDERSGQLCVYIPERVRERIAQRIALEMKSENQDSDINARYDERMSSV
ncbi:MAG: EAL domain-containing protein [Ruminiclostridium sp.]|nr:EAL domain-containing protein [Ruminiclostridium sp.]